MKITILGWYGFGNCGDDAYEMIFTDLLKSHEVVFVNDSAKIPSDTKLLIVGGGNILSTPFINSIASDTLTNVKKILISVSLVSDSAFSYLKYFDKIYLRDAYSVNLAFKHADKSRIQYLPDLAFLMQGSYYRGLKTVQRLAYEDRVQLKEKKVLVCLNDYLSQTPEFPKFARDLAEIIEETDASFIFLPFSTKQPWDDRTSNGWVADLCKNSFKKNLVINHSLTPQEILDVVSVGDLMISMRLHSSIFSTIMGVPFIDIFHHSKTKNFADLIPVESPISFWDFSKEEMSNLLRSRLESGGEEADKLKRFTKHSRELLKNVDSFIL